MKFFNVKLILIHLVKMISNIIRLFIMYIETTGMNAHIFVENGSPNNKFI